MNKKLLILIPTLALFQASFCADSSFAGPSEDEAIVPESFFAGFAGIEVQKPVPLAVILAAKKALITIQHEQGDAAAKVRKQKDALQSAQQRRPITTRRGLQQPRGCRRYGSNPN